jgi:hypothetical protein
VKESLEKLVDEGCVWADLSDVYDDSIFEEITPIAYVKTFPANKACLSDADVTRAVLCGRDVRKLNVYPQTLCRCTVCFSEVTSHTNEIGFDFFLATLVFRVTMIKLNWLQTYYLILQEISQKYICILCQYQMMKITRYEVAFASKRKI